MATLLDKINANVHLLALALALGSSGCATLATAAMTGGNERAVRVAARVDRAAFLGALTPREERVEVTVHHHHYHHRPRVAVDPESPRRLRPPPRPATSAPTRPERPSREQVARVLREREPELERCQSALRNQGRPHTTPLWFRIDPEGVPRDIETRAHEPAQLRSCVERIVASWRFPEAQLSTRVSVPISWVGQAPVGSL